MKRKIALACSIFILIVSVAPALWLMSVSYDEFCRLILTKSDKLYKLAEFQSGYLTLPRFYLLRTFAIALPFLISAAFYFGAKSKFIRRKIDDILAGIEYLCGFLKESVSGLSSLERAAMAALFSWVTLRTIYYAVTSPITSDEAWTYLTFVSRGLAATLSLNYSPNNHILYSIFGILTSYLPFDTTFNLRLPSVILTVACCFLFFVSIRLISNFLTALLSTSVLISLYPFLYYSIQARGYLLITVAFTLCFFAFAAAIKTERREFWVVYTVSAIFGAYTLPSFLYPFFSLSLFALLYFVFRRQYLDIRRLFISGVLVGLGVFVLYLPVFAVSGIAAVTSNEYVHPISRALVLQSLPEYSLAFVWWLFGALFAGLILMTLSPLLRSSKNELLVKIAYFCFLMVPLICLLHSVMPYIRVWTYLVVAVAAAAAVSIEKLVAKLDLKIWIASLLCLALIVLGEFNYTKRISADEYEAIAAKARTYMPLLAEENLKKFYVEETATSIYVNYYLTTHHRDFILHWGFPERFDRNEDYDCVILNAGNPISSTLVGYDLVFADDLSQIFLRSHEDARVSHPDPYPRLKALPPR